MGETFVHNIAEAKTENAEVVTDKDLADMFESLAEGDVVEEKEEVKEPEKEPEQKAEEEKKEEIEEPKEEPKPEVKVKDEENAERSRLGRKVAYLERKIEELTGQLAEKNARKEPEVKFDKDQLMTAEDVDKFIEAKQAQTAKQRQEYDKNYIMTLVELTDDMEEEVRDAVLRELDESPRVPHTTSAALNAKYDFLEAQAKVLRTKPAKVEEKVEEKVETKAEPKNPLDKNEGKKVKGLGVTGGDKVTPSAKKKAPELSKDELEYIKKMGLTPEDVEDALTNESPTLVILGGGQPISLD